jgi:hypothetical protein
MSSTLNLDLNPLEIWIYLSGISRHIQNALVHVLAIGGVMGGAVGRIGTACPGDCLNAKIA